MFRRLRFPSRHESTTMKTSSRYAGRVKRLAAIAAATVLAVVTLGAQAG